MKHSIFLLFSVLFFCNVQSQNIVYKKIAQRGDLYVNNNWQGKDSFLFAYNNDAIQTSLQALSYTANTWANNYRYTYTINAFGKVSTQIGENWVAGAWTNNTKYTNFYDANGYNTQVLYEVWNGNTWVQNAKIENNNIDALGNVANEYVYSFNGIGWDNQTWRYRTYVAGQTLTESEEKYYWDVQNNNWAKYERFFYSYFQGQIGTITHSLPDANAMWQSKDKKIYTYNLSPLQLTEYKTQKYDSILFVWQNLHRITYTYNADSLLDKTQNETFVGNGWDATDRAQYLYNASKQKIEYYTEANNAGNWDKNSRSTYNYTNNLVSDELQEIGVANLWQWNKKLFFNYDANANKIYDKTENYIAGSFVPFSQNFYYYNSFTVNVNDKIKEIYRLKLYPNPAQQKVFIQCSLSKNMLAQINVFNTMGNKIMMRTQSLSLGFNNIDLDISSLINGQYFVQIVDAESGKQQSLKFEIQK